MRTAEYKFSTRSTRPSLSIQTSFHANTVFSFTSSTDSGIEDQPPEKLKVDTMSSKSSSDSSATREKTSLLQLPPELRLRIYEYLCETSLRHIPGFSRKTLVLCRDLYPDNETSLERAPEKVCPYKPDRCVFTYLGINRQIRSEIVQEIFTRITVDFNYHYMFTTIGHPISAILVNDIGSAIRHICVRKYTGHEFKVDLLKKCFPNLRTAKVMIAVTLHSDEPSSGIIVAVSSETIRTGKLDKWSNKAFLDELIKTWPTIEAFEYQAVMFHEHTSSQSWHYFDVLPSVRLLRDEAGFVEQDAS